MRRWNVKEGERIDWIIVIGIVFHHWPHVVATDGRSNCFFSFLHSSFHSFSFQFFRFSFCFLSHPSFRLSFYFISRPSFLSFCFLSRSSFLSFLFFLLFSFFSFFSAFPFLYLDYVGVLYQNIGKPLERKAKQVITLWYKIRETNTEKIQDTSRPVFTFCYPNLWEISPKSVLTVRQFCNYVFISCWLKLSNGNPWQLLTVEPMLSNSSG